MFFRDVLYIILNSLVFSKRFYCSAIWSGTSKENIHKLQLMQKLCQPNTTNTKKFDHITPILHELGWLTIEELLCLCDVTMIFKCLSGLVPSYLRTKFVKRSETHSHCTKQNNQHYLPQCRTSSTQCAFRFRASKYWNSLPNDIRNFASIKVFKRGARLEIIRMQK